MSASPDGLIALLALTVRSFQLERLSTNIRDLRDLVTLSHKSPSASPFHSSPGTQWSPRSPLAETTLQHSQHARVTNGERVFARTQSAPASAAFFSRLSGAAAEWSNNGGPSGSLMPAHRIAQGRDSAGLGTSRRLARSKTGATTFARTMPEIQIYLSHNLLTT